MGIDNRNEVSDERPRDLTIRFATDDEVAALQRSIGEEQEFDRHLGRLVRSMSTLEDVIDDFLIENLAPPWGRDIFWTQFLERRGMSRKADDVRAITEFLPQPTADQFGAIVKTVKGLARRRNLLVHGIIEVGLPIGDSSTPFTVVHPKPDAESTMETTVSEMTDLVEEVDSVTYELIALTDDPAAPW